MLILLAVGGLAVGGWITWSSRVAGDVTVTWSEQSPACEGTTVEGSGSRRPVIEAVESMRCTVIIEVSNGSQRTVHLVRAVAPVVGPRTGAVVTAENATPLAQDSSFGIDALYVLDRDLRPGQSTEFDAVLVFDPEGCNNSGTLRSTDWPAVTIDVLGRSYDLYGDTDLAFHRSGATPGCAQLEG